MDNKDVQNCWQFWNCPDETRSKCPVYIKGLGDRCWEVKECFTTSNNPGPTEKKEECCRECRWFKKMNPDSTVKKEAR